MKKIIYLIMVIGALALIVAGCGLLTVPLSEEDELGSIASKSGANEEEYTNNTIKDAHKIKNKWDLKGSFLAHPGYNWGGFAEGATWEYSIHIKEAMNGFCSVGSIRFTTTTTTGEIIEVIGHVKQTSDSIYWGNLAAAGITEYKGVPYNFLFLFAERAMWFALSTEPYDSCWASGNIWPGGSRAYQLHSNTYSETFTLDYKIIHE